MGLRNFMKKCGARIQKPGAQKKRGGVKEVLEALSCLNSGTKQASANQIKSVSHSIQTGQTGLHECCPGGGLLNHTKVVLFYDLTSMGAGELGDAFISSNKFFNEMKQLHGFFGDVYHVGAYGERWVSWPAWVLDRNVHTRGIADHTNAPGTPGDPDALDELAGWVLAHGGGTVTGTVNGAILYDGSGDPNETTVYYGNNQVAPTMPPIFSSTEELLVIEFCDEAHVTPNAWGDITSYVQGAGQDYGPDGSYFIGGYYDGANPHPTIATNGSYVPTWMEVSSSHTLQVDNITQLAGAFALKTNATNIALLTDHSGDTANHVYDSNFWQNYGLGMTTSTNGCAGKTDSGHTGGYSSMFGWLSANQPAADIQSYKFWGAGTSCTDPMCCCHPSLGLCSKVLMTTQVTGPVLTSPVYGAGSTINQLVAWINTNMPLATVSAGMSSSAMSAEIDSHYGAGGGYASNAGIHLMGSNCGCYTTPASPDPCILEQPSSASELNYTYNFISVAGALTGSMDHYRQTTAEIPDVGTPTVLFQHDYCVAKKVINSHLGNIRNFVYSVPPIAQSRAGSQVIFPLHIIGAMENGPLGTAPTGSACTLTAATTVGPYDASGFNNMIAFGAGMGYNIVDLPCSSAQFSTDIQAYLNL